MELRNDKMTKKPVKKRYVVLAIMYFYLVSLPCFAIPFIENLTGNAALSWNGIGVDSNETVYIGLRGKIAAYRNGVPICVISAGTSRGYHFCVEKDDTITVVTSDTRLRLSLTGELISKEHGEYDYEYTELQNCGRTCYAPNGIKYSVKRHLFRNRVVREDGVVVYEMPEYDYHLRLMFMFAILTSPYPLWGMNKVNNKMGGQFLPFHFRKK